MTTMQGGDRSSNLLKVQWAAFLCADLKGQYLKKNCVQWGADRHFSRFLNFPLKITKCKAGPKKGSDRLGFSSDIGRSGADAVPPEA